MHGGVTAADVYAAWCFCCTVQVGNETLDIQMRYLTPMHSRGAHVTTQGEPRMQQLQMQHSSNTVATQ
jgi:hypothetical protein